LAIDGIENTTLCSKSTRYKVGFIIQKLLEELNSSTFMEVPNFTANPVKCIHTYNLRHSERLA
jgi:hypothetical protein